MAQKEVQNAYKYMIIEHSKRRVEMENIKRLERFEMLSRHKHEFDELKSIQERRMDAFKRELLKEEESLRRKKQELLQKQPTKKELKKAPTPLAEITNSLFPKVEMFRIPKRKREEVKTKERERNRERFLVDLHFILCS